jgi:hypothetical protein
MIKFSDFLELRINTFSANTESIYVQITNDILAAALNMSAEQLNKLKDSVVKIGTYHLWNTDFTVYFGRGPKYDDSYVNLGTKEIYIKYRGSIDIESISEEVIHELNHIHDFAKKYYNSSRGMMDNRDENKREFDAFTTQIGQSIVDMTPELKEQLKQWIERGFNLHEPNLPPVIERWQNHLLTLSPYFIKKFQSRLNNYIIKGIKKEI